MKCDNCRYLYYENASSNPDNAQPYPEICCSKGHWDGDCPDGLDEDELITYDPWKDCKDYKERDK